MDKFRNFCFISLSVYFLLMGLWSVFLWTAVDIFVGVLFIGMGTFLLLVYYWDDEG